MVYQSITKQLLAEARFSGIRTAELDVYFNKVSEQLKREYVEIKSDQLLGATEYIVWVRYFQTPFPGEIVKLPDTTSANFMGEALQTKLPLPAKSPAPTPSSRMDEHLDQLVFQRRSRGGDLNIAWVHDKHGYTEQPSRPRQISRVEIDSYDPHTDSHVHRSRSRSPREERSEKHKESRHRSASPRREKTRSLHGDRDGRHKDSRIGTSRHRHDSPRRKEGLAVRSREERHSRTSLSPSKGSKENRKSKQLAVNPEDLEIKELALLIEKLTSLHRAKNALSGPKPALGSKPTTNLVAACGSHIAFGAGVAFSPGDQEKFMEEKATRLGCRNAFFHALNAARLEIKNEHEQCSTEIKHYLSNSIVWKKFFELEPYPGVLPSSGHSKKCIDRSRSAASKVKRVPTEKSSVSNVAAPSSVVPPTGPRAISNLHPLSMQGLGPSANDSPVQVSPLMVEGVKRTGIPNLSLIASLVNGVENMPPRISGPPSGAAWAATSNDTSEPLIGFPLGPRAMVLPKHTLVNNSGARAHGSVMKATEGTNEAIPISSERLKFQDRAAAAPIRTMQSQENPIMAPPDQRLAITQSNPNSSSGAQSYNQKPDHFPFLIVQGKLMRYSEQEMMRITYSWMMDPSHDAVERDLACQLQSIKRGVGSGLRLSAVPFTEGDEKAGQRGGQVLRAWVAKAFQQNMFLSDFWATEKDNFPLPASSAIVTTHQALGCSIDSTKSPEGQLPVVTSTTFSETKIPGECSPSRGLPEADEEDGDYESDYAEIILESPSKAKRRAGHEQFEASLLNQASMKKRQKRFD